MPSKRVLAKEWRRKRKKQRMMLRLSIIAFCIVAAVGVGYIAWDMWSRTYVMTFEGQRVPTDDLRFFVSMGALWGGGGDPRNQALDQLTQNLLIGQAAQRHNLTPTAEDLEMAEQNLDMFEMMMGMGGGTMPNMPRNRMLELMATDAISMQLLDIYTADFEVDEEDYFESLMTYLTFNRENYVDMDFRVHVSNSSTASRIAWDDLASVGPEGYNDIIMRDLQLESEDDIPTTTLADLRNMQEVQLEPAVFSRLMGLGIGELSDPIPIWEDEYLILIADSFTDASDEEIAEGFRERYEFSQRAEIFTAILDGWRAAADIQINQRGLNAV